MYISHWLRFWLRVIIELSHYYHYPSVKSPVNELHSLLVGVNFTITS